MVSRLEKSSEWSKAEGRSESGVHAKIIFGFRAGDIRLRIVQAATGDDVDFGGRSWKRENQIRQRACYTQIGSNRSATARYSSMQEIVVDAVNAKAEWQICNSDRESDDGVVSGFLGVTQFPNRNRRPSAQTQSVGLLRYRRR